MRKACTEVWEGIVELAEGREHLAAQAHVARCPACQRAVQELREVFRLTHLGFYEAPEALLSQAVALMPEGRRRTTATLIRSSLALGGARSASDAFQLMIDADGVPVRVMFVPEGEGWTVLCKPQHAGWSLLRGDQAVEPEPAGGFRFNAASLADTAFTLDCDDQLVEVPSAEALLQSGAR